MPALTPNTDHIARGLNNFGRWDDFATLDTELWNTIDADSGASVAHDADGVGGKVLITTGATDNNEGYLYTHELFKFEAGKGLVVVGLIDFTESNTDDANVIFGLVNGVAANLLQDDGAGSKSSYTGALISKVDGGTKWLTGTNVAGTAQTGVSTVTAGGRAALRIEVLPTSGTKADVTFAVDPLGGNAFTFLKDSLNNTLKQEIDFGGSPTEMALVFGAKAGSANSEVISVLGAGWAGIK